jgi:phosphoglucosamine mutase
MMAVDDRGRFIPGDKMLAIFARALGVSNVVTTVDASMAIEEIGLSITRTPVGDNYVSQELKKGGGFGGEPSGAWVFPAISLCPDGIFAAAQVAAIAGREKLSRLADDLPAYPIRRGSIAIDGKSLSTTTLEARLSVLKPSGISRTDGIRLDFGDAWLLVRASGTEPKLRLTAEAKTETRLREIYDAAEKAINDRGELT